MSGLKGLNYLAAFLFELVRMASEAHVFVVVIETCIL